MIMADAEKRHSSDEDSMKTGPSGPDARLR